MRARGAVIEEKALKDDLQKSLNLILCGVSRAPALLLTDPTQQLESLNLERYEILASEPLHDIKGHITNLIAELPYILPKEGTAGEGEVHPPHRQLLVKGEEVWGGFAACSNPAVPVQR